MAKNIVKYMELNGVDRNKLSADLGISYTTITDWVKGKTYPRIDKIEMMANYFGINKSDLVEEKKYTDENTHSTVYNTVLKLMENDNQAFTDIITNLEKLNDDEIEIVRNMVISLSALKKKKD
ncbi:helix-turn-helix domain-containing protein [Enterococcus sp. AZ126]|uniref:helix-turn-helix domain-containing protein n=1 Tax=Enterococcus sp. AZ126 TaxID=2774635 RepID=UPI003F23C5ED